MFLKFFIYDKIYRKSKLVRFQTNTHKKNKLKFIRFTEISTMESVLFYWKY